MNHQSDTMVCKEYLDVINVVVRDAYSSTPPRAISAEPYIPSLYGQYGGKMYRHIEGYTLSMSYDEAWRRRVMERAFTRMVNKDKILTSKQTHWELHPDFDAKRFFKLRSSAEWVSHIYSDEVAQQHQSRVALLSLESFLDCNLGPISGKQFIKFFGPSAGEEYDALRIEDNKSVKTEPVSESVDLNRTSSSMATIQRERIVIDLDGDGEQNSSESEASSPIPLFTPISSPPSLQSAPSSFETNASTTSGASSTVAENPREPAAVAQPDMMVIEMSGQGTRVEAQFRGATVETPRQETQRETQPIKTGKNLRQQIPSATQPQKVAVERQGQHVFSIATPRMGATEKPGNTQPVTTSAGSASGPVTLESLLTKYPWISEAAKKTQERFPMDSFELVVSEGTLKFKCNDCPLNLYKAVYPHKYISNFEAHLRNTSHRQSVAARLGGVPAIVPQSSPASAKSSQSRVSGFAAQSSPSFHRRASSPRSSLRSSLAQQSSAEQDEDEDSDQGWRSLIVIIPVGNPLNPSNARKRARIAEPSEPGHEADNEDRAKRRRLNHAGLSTNPHTAKVRARLANLDPRTKQYESMIANDRKGAKNHVEHVVKRSAAYQHASPAERFALEERGRNDYMNARYDAQSDRVRGLLTHGRRKSGRDAESYARAHEGYNKITKEWGSAEGTPTTQATSMRSARYVDAATDSRDLVTEPPQDALEAPVPNIGTTYSRHQVSQSSAISSKAEHIAHLGHQKYHSSDDEVESQAHTGKDVESQIKASESSSFSNMVSEKRASMSGLFSLLEKRSETQRENFTAAHQLQVSTSEEVGILRSASYRHDKELDAMKNSVKREKDWRKYFDKSTKEDRLRLARLEAKVTREREDKQTFKMSIEGRVDATIKHHQTSSDATSKRLAALEQRETEQMPDDMSERVATLENLMTDQNKQLHQTLSGSMFKKVAALEKLVTDQNRQNQQNSAEAIAKKIASLEKQVLEQGKQNQQTSSDAMAKKVVSLEKLITDQNRQQQTLSGAMSRKMETLEKLVTDQNNQLVEQAKLIEMLAKRALASPRELSQTPRVEPMPSMEKERTGLSTTGAKPPLRPAWAK